MRKREREVKTKWRKSKNNKKIFLFTKTHPSLSICSRERKKKFSKASAKVLLIHIAQTNLQSFSIIANVNEGTISLDGNALDGVECLCAICELKPGTKFGERKKKRGQYVAV